MSISIQPTRYKLQSVVSGKIFEDSGWMLDAPDESQPTIIRAVYEQTRLRTGNTESGLYRFADWLPVKRALQGSSAPITFKSEKLSARLGLDNLFITFSGYWPERQAYMSTCSFKETEAYAVGGRLSSKNNKVLVVASAGNTARAFAKVCSDNNIPMLLCVPADYADSALWFDAPLNACVKLVVTEPGSDYFDAIHLSNIICKLPGFIPEGGAKNVARRDGMGTTVLSATTFIGRIPDYYFQAVGSGTGAIAAWEANLRFLKDGRYGHQKMKLMISQNAPFLPIFHSWKARSRQMLPYDDDKARRDVGQIDAKVLSNRKPPYPIAGGLFDALMDTSGEVLAIQNASALKAAKLFEDLEGIDLHPAAAVATASLIEAVENNQIVKDAIVLLNITGGGEIRFKKEHKLYGLKPNMVFPISATIEDIVSKIDTLAWNP